MHQISMPSIRQSIAYNYRKYYQVLLDNQLAYSDRLVEKDAQVLLDNYMADTFCTMYY